MIRLAPCAAVLLLASCVAQSPQRGRDRYASSYQRPVSLAEISSSAVDVTGWWKLRGELPYGADRGALPYDYLYVRATGEGRYTITVYENGPHEPYLKGTFLGPPHVKRATLSSQMNDGVLTATSGGADTAMTHLLARLAPIHTADADGLLPVGLLPGLTRGALLGDTRLVFWRMEILR